MRIAIDAGHGGHDSGAVGSGIAEKNVTLTLARLVEGILRQSYVVDITQIRTGDVYISPNDRDDVAEKAKADFFLSIHINSATDPKANGFETFSYTEASAKSRSIQTIIHREVANFMKSQGIQDRGTKEANFAVLRETSMPAVLVEVCFISNPAEATKLKSNKFLDGTAQAIARGVALALGLTQKAVPVSQAQTPAKDVWRVQIGAFTDKAKAEAQVKELQSKGYAAVIVKGAK